MASLWKKTLFYLGLVDDDQIESSEDPDGSEPPSRVRTIEPPAMPRTGRQGEASTSRSSRASGGIAGRRVEPPKVARRRMSSNPSLAEAGVYVESGGARALSGESEVIEARTFSDAQALADFIRAGTPVVLDLRTTEPAMVRRLVDFSTGLTYALEGHMAKVNQGVILITPAHSVIGVEEQQRLADLGLYQIAADEH